MMIYVNVEALKSEGRGRAGGNDWHDTDEVAVAVAVQLDRVGRTYESLGHGAIVGYRITVATEASPRRTRGKRWPLPVEGRVSRDDELNRLRGIIARLHWGGQDCDCDDCAALGPEGLRAALKDQPDGRES